MPSPWNASGGWSRPVISSYYLQFSPAEAWERIQSFAALLLQQFGLPGVALGVIGLVMYWRWSRLFILTLWTAVVFAVFAILYGSPDSYVYLMPVFLSFALWIGLGAAGLSDRFTGRSPVLRILFALLLTGYFAGRSMSYVSQVDASLTSERVLQRRTFCCA
jgi:hypothetical protein